MATTESQIKIRGLNEVVAGLRGMGADKELRALNLRVGNIVVREAKELVPVGKIGGGDLRDSIKAINSVKGVIVRAGQDPDIPYANVQEWGWWYDRKNFIYKKIAKRQYMTKAAGKVRSRIGPLYMQDLIAIYNKYSKKPFAGNVNLNRDLFDTTNRQV